MVFYITFQGGDCGLCPPSKWPKALAKIKCPPPHPEAATWIFVQKNMVNLVTLATANAAGHHTKILVNWKFHLQRFSVDAIFLKNGMTDSTSDTCKIPQIKMRGGRVPWWAIYSGHWISQWSLHYPPKQCTIMREIPQNYHRFVLFDNCNVGNLR